MPSEHDRYLDLLQFGPRVERSNVELTLVERARMFYWCRDQAMDCLAMAARLKGLGFAWRRQFEEGLAHLEVARSVFPVIRDRDGISIEDIMKGRVPDVEGVP